MHSSKRILAIKIEICILTYSITKQEPSLCGMVARSDSILFFCISQAYSCQEDVSLQPNSTGHGYNSAVKKSEAFCLICDINA